MEKDKYCVFTDGAARGNPGPASWAYVLMKNDKVLYEGKGVLGKTTNNVAEYTAIIKALENANDYGIGSIDVVSDSQLAINQLNRVWKVKKEHLRPLFARVMAMVERFEAVNFIHSPRGTKMIQRADMLANQALDEAGL